MGFRCQKCNKIGKKQHSIVIEKRDKFYHYYIVKSKGRYKTKKFVTESEEIANRKGNDILKKFNSRGWEIVKELIVCEQCAKKDKK